MFKLTNVSFPDSSKSEIVKKVYFPVATLNPLVNKYISIVDHLDLKQNFNPLVSSVGWLVEDLSHSSSSPPNFITQMDACINEGSGVLSFTLPNRSDYRHVRRGLYQICRQIDDWNQSHESPDSKASIFAMDCELQGITNIILAIGPIDPALLSVLKYKEIFLNEKPNTITNII